MQSKGRAGFGVVGCLLLFVFIFSTLLQSLIGRTMV